MFRLQCLTLERRKYECSKLNGFLVTIFHLEWGYYVNIKIPMRLGPAPTFRTFKNMSAVMLHFHMHICVYRMTRSINALNKKL